MNKTQISYLFAALVAFIALIAILFFAATDSKRALVFFIIASFLVLNGVFWIYRFAKERKASR